MVPTVMEIGRLQPPLSLADTQDMLLFFSSLLELPVTRNRARAWHASLIGSGLFIEPQEWRTTNVINSEILDTVGVYTGAGLLVCYLDGRSITLNSEVVYVKKTHTASR